MVTMIIKFANEQEMLFSPKSEKIEKLSKVLTEKTIQNVIFETNGFSNFESEICEILNKQELSNSFISDIVFVFEALNSFDDEHLQAFFFYIKNNGVIENVVYNFEQEYLGYFSDDYEFYEWYIAKYDISIYDWDDDEMVDEENLFNFILTQTTYSIENFYFSK